MMNEETILILYSGKYWMKTIMLILTFTETIRMHSLSICGKIFETGQMTLHKLERTEKETATEDTIRYFKRELYYIKL